MTTRMETLVERMRQLHHSGWVEQLAIRDGGLRCDCCSSWAAPEDVHVNEVFRFEGASDPGDESILFAISMPCGHRGSLPSCYGRYTPTEVADVMLRLRLHGG